MTEEEALLQTIKGNPQNTLNWAVYADWLDEYSREESPHINHVIARSVRAQFLLDTTSADDPSRQESAALAAQCRQAIIPALGPEISAILEAEPDRISFRNGMIWDLDLGYTNITSLPEGLIIGNDLVCYVCPRLASASNLTSGRYMDLAHCSALTSASNLASGGYMYLVRCTALASASNLASGGYMDLRECAFTELPADLMVKGKIYLSPNSLSQQAAMKIAEMDHLSRETRISALESLTRYTHLIEAVRTRLEGVERGGR